MSKITTQQAVDRLAALAAKIDQYKIELTLADGTVKEQTLKQWLQNIEGIEIGDLEKSIQDLANLVGNYANDDIDGNLDVNTSVIKNLSIAVSNINAAILRINDNDGKITLLGNTKADKTTTDAIQADINNLIEALVAQEVWTGDFALPLTANDNIIPWSADITNALNIIPAGRTITLKLQNMTGDPVSIFLTESVDDNSFTSESFNGDSDVQVKVTTTQFELNGLQQTERGDYKVIEIRSIPSGVTVDLTNLAQKDLSNVEVGASNVGKHFQVDTAGKLKLVNYISQIENGMEQRFYATGKQELWQGSTKISEDEVIFKNQYEEKTITIDTITAEENAGSFVLSNETINTTYQIKNDAFKEADFIEVWIDTAGQTQGLTSYFKYFKGQAGDPQITFSDGKSGGSGVNQSNPTKTMELGGVDFIISQDQNTIRTNQVCGTRINDHDTPTLGKPFNVEIIKLNRIIAHKNITATVLVKK